MKALGLVMQAQTFIKDMQIVLRQTAAAPHHATIEIRSFTNLQTFEPMGFDHRKQGVGKIGL